MIECVLDVFIFEVFLSRLAEKGKSEINFTCCTAAQNSSVGGDLNILMWPEEPLWSMNIENGSSR